MANGPVSRDAEPAAGAAESSIDPLAINEQLVLAALRAQDEKDVAETQLHSIRQLAALFDEAPVAIFLLRGPSLTIELVNPRSLELWGKTSAIQGQPLLQALPELEAQGWDVLLRGVLQTGVAHHGKDVLVQLDRGVNGQLDDVYLDFSFVLLRGSMAGSEAVLIHAYDVTDKVLARRHADAMRCEAETANRLKDEFLATIGHELRTPLNSILGWASLLRRGKSDESATARGLESIERNAKSQARIIDDLLDVSRIISGKLSLAMKVIDVDAVAAAAADVVRPAASAKHLNVQIDIELDESIHLIGDAERLVQMLWNLLSNAVRFTPPEGTVVLRVERVGGSVVFIVRDTGSGIPAPHLPFIFERFRQADSSVTRKHGGLGLGLAIVRHLAELHGGTVSAANNTGGPGASFTVELPIAAVFARERNSEPPTSSEATEPKAETHPDAPRGERRPSVPLPNELSGLELLVVEDDDDSRRLIQEALEAAGASVSAVSSAGAAFSFIEEHRVDVLVSDIGMPDEDGLSLIKRVRALPTNRGGAIPAVALTAYARHEDAALSLRAGFQIHLTKPVDIDELASSVASLAARASLESSSLRAP